MKTQAHKNSGNTGYATALRRRCMVADFRAGICDLSLNLLNRTPMSTLDSTPIIPVSASLISHHPHLWLRYPVAIAGHVVRSLSTGTGFFKLQLQCVVGLSHEVSMVIHWSCNLKKKLSNSRQNLFFRTPMTMLLSPLHWQHRHTERRPAARSHPVASAG